MSGSPLVTVITTVYNKRETIYDSIKSVCNQDYPDIEYIIVDDGPNNIEDELILNYYNNLDKRVNSLKIIHNTFNLGISESLNVAVHASTGNYILKLADDDCFYDEHVISDWIKEFEKTNAQIITASIAVCSKDLKVIKNIAPPPSEINAIVSKDPSELFEYMVGYNRIFGCSTAYTKAILCDYPFISEYKIIEDYPHVMKLLHNNIKVHYYNRIVIKYREGGISSISNIDSRYLNESDLIFRKEILPYTKKKIVALIKYHKWKRNLQRYQKQRQDV